jgi:four helix bundle protein
MDLRRKFNGAKHSTEATGIRCQGTGDRYQKKDKKMGHSTFEDLEVLQRAYTLSLEIHKASLNFPSVEPYGLGKQIRNASTSICANIAEGFGKRSYSKAEWIRYLKVAVGSSDEMRVWTRYCLDLGYVEART